MSRGVRDPGLEDLPDPICWYCGTRIEEEPQDCPARDDGRCRP